MIYFFKNLLKSKKLSLIGFVLFLFCLLALLTSDINSSASVPNASFWLWRYLGRLHPLMVHFPIGVLIVAAIGELFTLNNFFTSLRSGIRLMLGVGVMTAACSVLFGLLLAKDGDYGKELLSLHQWIGIATFFLGAISWYLLQKIINNNKVSWIRGYRSFLFLTAIGVGLAGHFGASLTHGADYLSSTLPWSSDYDGVNVKSVDPSMLKNDTAKLNAQQILELNVQVRAIVAHNCYKCHGAEKVKGDLRLDRRDLIFKGGEHGEIIIPGNPDESELYRRINLPDHDKELMPSKGKKLAASDIALIRYWIQKGAPWPAGVDKGSAFRVALLAPRNPALPAVSNDLNNPIDLWTNQYFSKNKIAWPTLVNDQIFLKRIFLDIIGLLPTPEEVQLFVNDKQVDKRERWVRLLLDRQDDYATHWLSFWNDLLRNDYTGTGYITGGRYEITDWLYKAIKDNKRYDQFAKELVSPSENSKGFIEGIKWRGVINASQRTEMQAAQNVSQVFFGLNLKCASCHNSFISDWKLVDSYGLANIFADSSLEINRCDKPTGKYTRPSILWKELGSIDSSASRKIKMAQLAVNMIKPENGRFYRTAVNRIWKQLMGRGLVEPVDQMDNAPWSQDLLDWMAYDFQQKGSNLKELIYLIATSKTYQLPSVGLNDANQLVAQDFMFKGMLRKRMSAEQFADAAGSVVAPIFPDSIAMYKPPYNPGYLTSGHYFTRASLVANNSFLTALGRPNRETVTTSRDMQANLLQALELTNGDRFNAMLVRAAEAWKKQYGKSDIIINELYKRALGRSPNAGEYEIAKKRLGPNASPDAIQDLFWSVMLLPEFQLIY